MPITLDLVLSKLKGSLWAKTLLIGVATIIEGVLLFKSLELGFAFNNFQPFYTTLAGTGWYAWIVTVIVSWKVE